jgi:methyl-accepting chemotaxis protein
MQQQSIFRPIILAASVITIASLILLTVGMYHFRVNPIAPAEVANAVKEAELEINNRIQNKVDSSIAMATTLANYSEIKQGLIDGDRDPVINKLKSLKDDFAAISPYKNISAHVITAEKLSFVKSWDLDNFSGPAAHPLVNKTIETKQVSGTLGVGAKGISTTGFAPILNNGTVIGIVTAVQGVASVVKTMKAENKDWVLLLDDSYLQDRYKGVPATVKDNIQVDSRYRLAHNTWFDADAVKFVTKYRNTAINGEATSGEIIGNRILIDVPIKDELGKIIGRSLMIEDATPILNKIADATYFVWVIIASVALLIIAISALLLWLVKRNMVNPLTQIVTAIGQTIESGRFSQRMNITKHDELGVLMDAFNQLLINLESSITEANHVVGALAKGDFGQRMTQIYVGDLNLLKEGINTSVSNVSETMRELDVMMIAMQAGDFEKQVTIDASITGDFRKIIVAAVATSSSLHTMISDINTTMSQVSQGNFSTRVSSDAQGNLLVLKDAINTTLDTLQSVVANIEHVLTAQSLGDLSGRVNAQCDGQLAQLKTSINQTSDKLQGVVLEVNQSAQAVSYIAEQVFQGAQNLASRVQQQASALEETAATMEEMNAAIQNTTGNAQHAASLADNVRDKAAAGESVMRKSIEAMAAIRDSSTKINDIVSLIDSIAFQTNLLALNAAVEAARAGEHGRGFAVVASEVRTLAQKSANAAKEIRDLIAHNGQHIEAGTRLADESGAMLVTITDSITQVSGAIGQIAAASAEQASGIAQAHQAISEIDRVTQENATLSEETNAAANNMKEQAAQLTQTMAFFDQPTTVKKRISLT